MSHKIECPLCNEFYHIPKIVIYACCLQHFCKSCFEEIVEKPCPYCRSPFIYGPEYMSKLLSWSEKHKLVANYCLANYYRERNIEKSIHYLTLVATAKQEEPYLETYLETYIMFSLFNLGNIFINRKDYEKALHYLKLATDKGSTDAYNTIGFMYEEGLGVTQSSEKAFQYHKIAADKGNEMAQFNVGIKYDDGQGVVKDSVLAIKYLTLSADQGCKNAIKILPGFLIEHEYPIFEILYRIKNALVLMKESDSNFTYFEEILKRSTSYCGSCQSHIYKSLHCGKCKIIYYCNYECQKRDWKEGGHKQECK